MFRRPTEAPFRVGIIADADRLGAEAENLLLRTLEEPPPRSMFILTVEDASALLPTTVSRCQCIRLRPVPREEIAAALMERHGVEADRAAMLAALSEGRPGWAIEAASNPAHLAAREAAIERAERAALGSRLERLGIARTLAESWTAKSAEVRAELRLWSGWWRDAILAGRGLDRHVANADRLPALERAAQRLGPTGLRTGARAIAQLQADLEQNANARLAFDVALLELP
jgi:DNA polymerase-3 subunit delta'